MACETPDCRSDQSARKYAALGFRSVPPVDRVDGDHGGGFFLGYVDHPSAVGQPDAVARIEHVIAFLGPDGEGASSATLQSFDGRLSRILERGLGAEILKVRFWLGAAVQACI